MFCTINLDVVNDNDFYICRETNVVYPPTWDKETIPSLVKVIESTPLSDTNLRVAGFHIDENFNQVWDYVNKTEEELLQELELERSKMELTKFQCRAILLQLGILDQVSEFFEQSQNKMWVLAWNEANYILRNSDLVKFAATQFNLSDEQLDNMFRTGMSIGV